MKKIKFMIIGLLVSIIIPITNVNAASTGSMYFSGPSYVNTDETFIVDIVASETISDTDGALMSAGGLITTDDSSCIEIVNAKMLVPGIVYNNKFAYSDLDGNKNSFTMVRITLKAGSNACNTNINIIEPLLAYTDSTKIKMPDIYKNITVRTNYQNNSKFTLKNLVPLRDTL